MHFGSSIQCDPGKPEFQVLTGFTVEIIITSGTVHQFRCRRSQSVARDLSGLGVGEVDLFGLAVGVGAIPGDVGDRRDVRARRGWCRRKVAPARNAECLVFRQAAGDILAGR